MRLPSIRKATNGFTLIELLVVAPIAIITIATLISLMVALVGDVAVSRERSVSTYDVQDALDRIEQDARIATTYMPTFSLFASPQGENDATGAFTSASGDLIISQYATTANPYDPARKIVYYADQPYACNSTYTLNRPMTNRVIYFTKASGGVTSLWRRTIVPSWTTINPNTTKVCNAPWQRDSCSPAVMPNANCQAQDEKMLDYVSSFAVTYYSQTGAVTTDVRNSTSLKVSLTQTKSISGDTVATNGVARASHVNVTTDDVPIAPSISIYNPAINSYNNPILTTFTWDDVKNAAVYGVRYQINGGSWVNAPDQTGTQFQVTNARPENVINIGVTSKNDMGTSSETTYSYTKPLWTDANLEGDWDCYSSSYSCASYTVLSSNLIVIRGMVKNGTAGTPIFTLPPGLCPLSSGAYATYASSNVFARVDVNADCSVKWVAGGTNAWVSLDPIRYNNALAGLTWTSPTLSNSWAPFGANPFVVASDSQGRTNVRGWLTPGTVTNATTYVTLPTNYREKGGAGIYPGVYSGTNDFAFMTWTTDTIRARGMGATWAAHSALYPNNLSTAPVTAVAAQAGWTNYGSVYTTMKYTKFGDGLICFQGLIVPTVVAGGTLLFTLPAGQSLWPSERQLFTVIDYGTNGTSGSVGARVDVNSNGRVTIQAGATASQWMSMAGICYLGEL